MTHSCPTRRSPDLLAALALFFICFGRGVIHAWLAKAAVTGAWARGQSLMPGTDFGRRELRDDAMAKVRQDIRIGIIVDLLDIAAMGAEPTRIIVHSLGHSIAIGIRSEEHTSELQSLMRISYAVFCLKKKNTNT